MLIEIIIGVIVLSIIGYKWMTRKFSYFENLGIPYEKPKIFVGSYWRFFFKLESLRDEFLRSYDKFKKYKVFGIFEGNSPVYVVNDVELLKKITIKDFEYFKNHKLFVDPEQDPLFGNSVFALKNEKWHDMRTTLSPAFTGSKMRLMFQLVLDICERATKHLEINVKNKPNSENGIDFETKDFFTLYTSDAIASTAFGLDVNSLEDKENQFYKMGRDFITFSTWDMIKFTLNEAFGSIFKIFGITVANEKFNNYFYRLVVDAMKYRKDNNIVRQDMINMLMEAQSNPEKSHNREWSNNELVAQCLIFLFAGLESVSTTLCFATQELIENPNVQIKLRKEIDSIVDQLNGEQITYEMLQNMKYLDMFISEVLRKWPPFINTDRVCTKPYKIDEENLQFELKVDDVIWIPVVGLHLNEEYFPDPLKFDPERFNEENKPNIKPMSYGPFGFGPRICIGSRLALLECKAILFFLLKNFKLDVGEKSKIPPVLSPTSFPITMKDGFWLKMVPRQ